jgi:hypothetical protein
MTNEKWEENRKIFSEKYKNNLPSKIKVTENDKLKVLIGCLFFREFTGSEMYVYELSKNLLKMNVDVSIVAYETVGRLSEIAKKEGIKVYNITEPPGFKMGDGIWRMSTPNGIITTEKNKYYRISNETFDIIHYQHQPVVNTLNNLYPDIKKIYTIHSEVISLENPIINESVKKYIAIRPEIKECIVKNFNVPENLVEVIYNPINSEKFNIKNTKDLGYTLFVGTIDEIRKQTIFDLIKTTKENNKTLYIVGKNQSNYLNSILNESHVKYFDSTIDVQKYVKDCSETAGILLGRTTIEGWMCGKSGWIYNIDNLGNIIDKKLHEPPLDVERFDSLNVTKKIKQNYIDIINL